MFLLKPDHFQGLCLCENLLEGNFKTGMLKLRFLGYSGLWLTCSQVQAVGPGHPSSRRSESGGVPGRGLEAPLGAGVGWKDREGYVTDMFGKGGVWKVGGMYEWCWCIEGLGIFLGFWKFFFQARPGLTVSRGSLLLLFSHLRFHDCLGSLSQVQGSIVVDLPTIYCTILPTSCASSRREGVIGKPSKAWFLGDMPVHTPLHDLNCWEPPSI